MVLSALSAAISFLICSQEGKEIKLTEKHIQSFMDAYNDMAKVFESADPDKPDDPKVEAQAEAIAKKNGFASLAEFDDVSASISAVMSGIRRSQPTRDGAAVSAGVSSVALVLPSPFQPPLYAQTGRAERQADKTER
jgi:hypothetical protein